jgi:hypothetical protein
LSFTTIALEDKFDGDSCMVMKAPSQNTYEPTTCCEKLRYVQCLEPPKGHKHSFGRPLAAKEEEEEEEEVVVVVVEEEVEVVVG